MIRWIYKLSQILVVLGILIWFPLNLILIFPTGNEGHVASFLGLPVVVLLLPVVAIMCILLYFAGRYEKRGNFKMGAILLCLPAALVALAIGVFLVIFPNLIPAPHCCTPGQ